MRTNLADGILRKLSKMLKSLSSLAFLEFLLFIKGINQCKTHRKRTKGVCLVFLKQHNEENMHAFFKFRGLILYMLLLMLCRNPLPAQAHLSGEVFLDLETGLFRCKLTLSQLPQLEHYQILLNKGMNIKYFRDQEGQLLPYEGYYGGKMRGGALQYSFVNEEEEKIPLPSTFSVEYLGAFPRYVDSLNTFDYNGFISINAQTLRAAAQTVWYPQLYDESQDRIFDLFTYDLSLKVNKETMLFVNGSIPKKAKSAHFSSEKARPLLLFIGDYEVITSNGNYLLNLGVDAHTAELVMKSMDEVKGVLSEILKRPFTHDPIFLINHQDVDWEAGRVWAFNQYPALVFSGLDFATVLNEQGQLPPPLIKGFGHEFAHNFFGLDVFRGELAWFWLESFPEYLSFEVAGHLCPPGYVNSLLLKMASSLQEASFVPLPQIEKAEEINEAYRYVMGPLILKCFADTFGKANMHSVLRKLLKYAEIQPLSLDLWKQAAMESGIDPAAFEEFYAQYVADPKFKEHVWEFINKKYE